MSDARECESHLRQLHETIKRQYTCDKNSRLSKLEDLLQDSMVSDLSLLAFSSWFYLQLWCYAGKLHGPLWELPPEIHFPTFYFTYNVVEFQYSQCLTVHEDTQCPVRNVIEYTPCL